MKGIFCVLISVFVLTSHNGDTQEATGDSILDTVSISAMSRLEQEHTNYDNDNLRY